MKYEVTADDLKVMAFDLANDRTLKHLKNLSFYKFAVGDVLIREEKYRTADGHQWKTKLADCGLPNKYVYVFENDLGIGYIRRLSVNGRKFVDKPLCVTEFDPDQTRFALDPEYADHMILSDENAEFDAKSRYDEIKKKREQIHRQNKKNRLMFSTPQQAVDWMKTLKVGDQIWYGYSISGIHKSPYYVHAVNILYPLDHSNLKVSGNAPISSAPSANFAMTLSMHSLLRYSIFMSKPIFVDEIIN